MIISSILNSVLYYKYGKLNASKIDINVISIILNQNLILFKTLKVQNLNRTDFSDSK